MKLSICYLLVSENYTQVILQGKTRKVAHNVAMKKEVAFCAIY